MFCGCEEQQGQFITLERKVDLQSGDIAASSPAGPSALISCSLVGSSSPKQGNSSTLQKLIHQSIVSLKI